MSNFIDTFFYSISHYINVNQILFITLGLFLFAMFVVIITTSNSYEVKLIKSINRFNNYFNNNPQLTEDNLLQFNRMMKSGRVPHLICKQWQQFVLYREEKASSYLSYDVCVNNPLKNSSYKRDVKIMNLIAYIVAILSFVVNIFCTDEVEIYKVFRDLFLGPTIVLALNWFVTAILSIKYNAIVNDINQTFSFFQVNMDKATQTIPEYVDYEVLFDKNEIRRGIPILYAYLQKRAEDEKRELERARLKNVEHEKFNFDEAGVESSLVLERAMQEAENYIAERKKFMEDTSQVNNEINQEDLNYREITKEYQRQMQVSKESFNNFKDQLNEVSSTIEANYLKKQQQQELDRQRNLERDYDAATERHKKAIESLQQELSELEKNINSSRTSLEKAMMSEFATYGSKVYDAAHKLATYRQQEKITDLKKEIKQLEEKIVLLTQSKPTDGDGSNKVDNNLYLDSNAKTEPSLNENNENELKDDANENELSQQVNDIPTTIEEENNLTEMAQTTKETQPVLENDDIDSDDEWEFDFDDDEEDDSEKANEEVQAPVENSALNAEEMGITFNYLDENNSNENSGQNLANEETLENAEKKQTKKAGRPRKILSPEEINKPKRPRGRPKKEVTEEEINKPKRPRGRPKKEETTSDNKTIETAKKRGRPKKVEEETVVNNQPKKRGRPRKVIIIEEGEPANEPAPKTGKRGRPRKIILHDLPNNNDVLSNSISDIDEYLKAIDSQIAEENLKIEQTQKELEKNTKIRRRKK